MIAGVLEAVALWTKGVISSMGYAGIVLTMAIESACIPLPSEIIMPFSGFLVSEGRFTMLGVSVAGAFGCVVGSVIAYWAGVWGGRPFLERYGRYLLIRKKDLDHADRFFEKYGEWAIFLSRLMPVIRTFISLPAGIARMNFWRFVVLTFLGSLPWCWALAYVGKILGENWSTVGKYFHQADIVIGVIILIGVAWFLYAHLKPEKEQA